MAETFAKDIAVNGIRGVINSHESRKEERFVAGRTIEAIQNGKEFSACLVECSLHGLQLVCPHAMKAGEHFAVILRIEGQTHHVAYEIRYCRKVWDDAYQVGAQRVDRLTVELEKFLLLELLKPDSQD